MLFVQPLVNLYYSYIFKKLNVCKMKKQQTGFHKYKFNAVHGKNCTTIF